MSRRRVVRRAAAVAVALLLPVAAAVTVAAAESPTGQPRLDRATGQLRFPDRASQYRLDQWIVELDAQPLARYRGGVDGLKATAPARGEKVDADSAAAKAYRAELDDRQKRVLSAAAPGVKPAVEYRVALAGFAAKLTDGQVAALRRQSGVRRVTREQIYQLDASAKRGATTAASANGLGGSEAELMGLPDGLWKRLGGPRKAGQGVVVGIVDSGITPEAPSFAQKGLKPPASWDGACQGGEQFPTNTCNNKLIGARYFGDGLFPPGELPEGAYRSPRDEAGHGTHVAASAVGDENVDPRIADGDLGVGEIAGAAPGAYLAVYKACWLYGECSEVDVVAAIDRAVADGVDVLNLSLGTPLFPDAPKVDPTQLALLNADAAGVFVAAAAGNAGDHPLALGSPAAAPWTTAVGATTSMRTFRATVTAKGAGGASLSFAASGVARAVPDAPVIDMRTLTPNAPDPFADARYCFEGFEPEDVRGKVVLCDLWAPLGLVTTTLKAAGARGVIFSYEDAKGEDITEAQVLPALFAAHRDVNRLRELARQGGATGGWSDAGATARPADRVAWFSSRGPSPVTRDLLRPDVAAPGAGVLSAYAPNTYAASTGEEPHERYAVLNGTSMASPQIAGVGALLTQLHPTWSSAAIRSALATTARKGIDSDGEGDAPRVAAGGGRVDPQAAAGVGLVVEPSTEEYQRYAEGIDPASIPGDPTPIAARDLNLPSISLGKATEPIGVKRTVRSVASGRGEWTTSVEGIPGDYVRISPARFTLAPGQKRELGIEVRYPVGARGFQDAAIVLRNGATGERVRLPLALDNPGILDPPERLSVTGAGADGAQAVKATVASYQVSGIAHGLAAPKVQAGLETRPNPAIPQINDHIETIDVPAGTSLLAANVRRTSGSPEFGLVRIWRESDGDGRFSGPLLGGGDTEVASSPISDDPPPAELNADVAFPEAGRYYVEVYSYPSSIRFDLRTYQVRDPKPNDPDPAPGLKIDGQLGAFPASEDSTTLRWNGVSGSEPLRGLVAWYDGERADARKLLATSIVDLTPGSGQPALRERQLEPPATGRPEMPRPIGRPLP